METKRGCRSIINAARRGRMTTLTIAVGVLALVVGSVVGVLEQPRTVAGAVNPHSIQFGAPVWQQTISDGSNPIALSSPNVATLPGGPSVVVGDEAGYVYTFNLATGAKEWTYDAGAPVNSTPSVAAVTGSSLDSVFVGTGDAAEPTAGGYQAISPSGADQWFVRESNPGSDATAEQRRAGLPRRGEPAGEHRRDGRLPGTGTGRAHCRQRLNAERVPVVPSGQQLHHPGVGRSVRQRTDRDHRRWRLDRRRGLRPDLRQRGAPAGLELRWRARLPVQHQRDGRILPGGG